MLDVGVGVGVGEGVAGRMRGEHHLSRASKGMPTTPLSATQTPWVSCCNSFKMMRWLWVIPLTTSSA